MRKVFNFLLCLCMLSVLTICSAGTLTVVDSPTRASSRVFGSVPSKQTTSVTVVSQKPKVLLSAYVANPVVPRMVIYEDINTQKSRGMLWVNELTRLTTNSFFKNISFYDNGVAKVTYSVGNKEHNGYIHTNILTKCRNIAEFSKLRTVTFYTEEELYFDENRSKKIYMIPKGTTCKVLYQAGNMRQVHVRGNGIYPAIGWVYIPTRESTAPTKAPAVVSTPKKLLTIQVGNPINSNMTVYANLTAKQSSGNINIGNMTRMEANSVFGNIDFYDNGLAEVEYFDRSLKDRKAYIKISDITTANIAKIASLPQKSATKKYTLYGEESLKNKVYDMAVGKTYKVLAQKGKLKQIYAYGKGQYSAIGWINDGSVDSPKITLTNNPMTEYVLGPGAAGTDSTKDVIANPTLPLPKKLLTIQVGNPINSNMTVYSSLTAKQSNGSLNVGSMTRMEANSVFGNIDFYANGLAEVEYFDRSLKARKAYIKISDITTANIAKIASLPQKSATKKYTLYGEESLKNKVYDMAVGKTYKVLAQKGNLKQIYAYGKGQYSAIGWINDANYQKGILGDVNDDKIVNRNDLTLMDNYLNGKTVDINLLNADLSGDGKVDIVDRNLVVYEMNGISKVAKKILDVAMCNPRYNSFGVYRTLNDTTPYKNINTSSLMVLLQNARFLDAEIYNNGLTKVTYYLQSSKKHETGFVKTTDIVCLNSFKDVSVLKSVVADKAYTLYAENSCTNVMNNISVGKEYKIIYKSGNCSQVYFKGLGQESFVGWIRLSTNIKGDVDGNGKVDEADLNLLKKHIADSRVVIDMNNADINNSGKVDLTDVSQLKEKLVVYTNSSIANGWYEIVSAGNSNIRLDVDNGQDVNNTNIKLWTANAGNAQKFYLQNNGDGTFTLKTGCSTDKYVDIMVGTFANVYQYQKRTGNENTQKFRLIKINTDTNIYFIEPVSKVGYSIACSGNKMSAGNNVEVQKRINTAAHKWRFVATSAPIKNVYKVVYPANGVYSFQPKCAPDKELTVENASTANGANVFIYSIASNWHTHPSHQKWIISRINNSEWYKIIAENSGLALNVHNGYATNGTNVSIWPYGGNMHQYRFIDTGDGYYAIQANIGSLNQASYVLGVNNGSNSNGANVAVYGFLGTHDSQKWKMVKRNGYSTPILKDGWYNIMSTNSSGKGLDVSGAGTTEGSNIILYQFADQANQKFYLENKGTGWFTLKAGHCEAYVTAANASGANKTNIQLHRKNNNDTQLWRLINAGGGYYYIESKLRAGLVFDCANGGSANSTNIQLWDKSNVAWHKWKFNTVSAPVLTPVSDDAKYWESMVNKKVAVKLDSQYYKPQVTGKNPFKKSYTENGVYHATNCTWYAIGRFAEVNGQWLGVTGGPSMWVKQAKAKGYTTGYVPRSRCVGANSRHVYFIEYVDGNNVYITETNVGGNSNTTKYDYIVRKRTLTDLTSLDLYKNSQFIYPK